MKRQSLYFTAPNTVEVREESLPALAPGEVRVQTLASAISPGTEMLVYRDQVPHGLAVDENIAALEGTFEFPLKYGYACVGRVVQCGAEVEAAWQDQLVFAFNPHESHFNAAPESVWRVPDDIDADTALFLPNMETAINLVQDGGPLLGERVAVVGQGVVGLLTTALLAMYPLAALTTFDRYPLRREASLACGAHASLDPAAEPDLHADLTYEVSGSPAALDTAIAVTGFDGRVVIGSWYGQKRAPINLGGWFHRSRMQLISSQVSTIRPALQGRWNKTRRLALVWEMLRRLPLTQLITHRVDFANAAQAYALIDQHPETCVQVVLGYE